MTKIPDPMPTEINEEAWKFLARVARERREFIGLSQEELAGYGGPGKSTVSKIERAAQFGYPPRTQQQLEKALGWDRGAVRSILLSAMSDFYGESADTIAIDFVEDELPDLTINDVVSEAVRSASDLSDDELLAELTYRMKRYAQEKNGGSGDGKTLAQKRAEVEADRRRQEELSAAGENLSVASLETDPSVDQEPGETEES